VSVFAALLDSDYLGIRIGLVLCASDLGLGGLVNITGDIISAYERISNICATYGRRVMLQQLAAWPTGVG